MECLEEMTKEEALEILDRHIKSIGEAWSAAHCKYKYVFEETNINRIILQDLKDAHETLRNSLRASGLHGSDGTED